LAENKGGLSAKVTAPGEPTVPGNISRMRIHSVDDEPVFATAFCAQRASIARSKALHIGSRSEQPKSEYFR
jgi:hypothetical protein